MSNFREIRRMIKEDVALIKKENAMNSIIFSMKMCKDGSDYTQHGRYKFKVMYEEGRLHFDYTLIVVKESETMYQEAFTANGSPETLISTTPAKFSFRVNRNKPMRKSFMVDALNI